MTFGSRRSRGAKNSAKIVISVGLLLSAAAVGSSAAESPNYPGLPSYVEHGEYLNMGSANNWIGPRATGINEVAAAKQWARLPAVNLLAWNFISESQTDPSCRRLGPLRERQDFHAQVFFISQANAPKPFGYIGPFTVRTVAFGSVPVEAEVLIGQARDVENLPVPQDLKMTSSAFCGGRGPNAGPGQEEVHWTPVDMKIPIDISIVGLKADGVDLQLKSRCQPTKRSTLQIGSREYFSLAPDVTAEDRTNSQDPLKSRFFNVAVGGLLTGKIDIGEFAGCLTASGEDISALLTATVSGPDNNVRMRSEGLVPRTLSCMPDRSKCPEPLPGLPYPEPNAG